MAHTRTTAGLLVWIKGTSGDPFDADNWTAPGHTLSVVSNRLRLAPGDPDHLPLASYNGVASRAKALVYARMERALTGGPAFFGPAALITDTTAASPDGVTGRISVTRSPEIIGFTQLINGAINALDTTINPASAKSACVAYSAAAFVPSMNRVAL